MYTFLLVVQAIVTLGLITVILMQKSEGGGLGTGGSPTGLLSAHGAKDFLTRTTAILATTFVSLSIILAVMASIGHRSSQVDTNARAATAPNTPADAPVPPVGGIPLGGGAPATGGDPLSAAAGAAPLAPATGQPASGQPTNGDVPLQK